MGEITIATDQRYIHSSIEKCFTVKALLSNTIFIEFDKESHELEPYKTVIPTDVFKRSVELKVYKLL
jgi:hypothetical protein